MFVFVAAINTTYTNPPTLCADRATPISIFPSMGKRVVPGSRRRYSTAMGFTGDPVPPTTFSGAIVSMNS